MLAGAFHIFVVTGITAAALLGTALVAATDATAAQSYSCLCKGKARSFRASTNYCEHIKHVRSCSLKQLNAFYTPICASMRCTLNPFVAINE